MEYLFDPRLDRRQVNGITVLGLAHMGDAVYEILVRTWLITEGDTTGAHLHRDTTALVNAPAQAAAAERILPILSEEELAVYKRGRNAGVRHIPKNATHSEYSKATGLEALFGYLYLIGEQQRAVQLFTVCMEGDHAT